VAGTFAGHRGNRILSVRMSERMSIQNSTNTKQDLKRSLKEERALINEDQNLFRQVF
jgi:hypothetical protein